MIPGDPHCFGHPTKVTFTFSEKCLKNDRNANIPPYASYWSASPYGDSSTVNIQSWLAHKMKTQRQKLKLERAVQRAEKKLKIEYDKQMELKRKAADERFKVWLKSKSFANQTPVMLYRNPPNTENTSTSTLSDSKRPKTARESQKTRGSARPRSASAPGNRRQITSTLDIKPVKPKPTCKALDKDDFMKMRHLAGKRYKKLKDEKFGFQCEDQILRKLQDLDWEEKVIKSKMVYSEKEDLGKVKAKALKQGKKKLKFKGDVITVEVEEIESNADVDITFEEVDDKCSDIGCIEKEGVDFHIESKETIDFSDKGDKEPCRPISTLPPKIECEETFPTPPSRPKSSKPRSVDKEKADKKETVKEVSADSKKSEKKSVKEDKSKTKEEKSATKGTKKDSNAAEPKEKASLKTAVEEIPSTPPKEKESSKKVKDAVKEDVKPTSPKEKETPKKTSEKKVESSTSKEEMSPKLDKTPEKAVETVPSDESSKKKSEPSQEKEKAPAKEKVKEAKSKEQAQPTEESAEKKKKEAPPPKEVTKTEKQPVPSAEKVSQKVEQSTDNEATGKKPAEESKKAEEPKIPADTSKKPAEDSQKPAKDSKNPAEDSQKPARDSKKPAEDSKKAKESPTEKTKPPKEGEKSTAESPKSPTEKADKTITSNGKVVDEKIPAKDPSKEKVTAVDDSNVASDSFFD